MKKPRLAYYSDAHHFHAKRLDPPLNVQKLQWPVDELVGTGVDLLVFGLGYGDVYFHQSKIGPQPLPRRRDASKESGEWRNPSEI